MHYQQRIIQSKLREYLDFFSVVGVTGPRQAGKSTLIQHELKDYEYVTFDNRENIALFYDDPQKFMRIYNHHVVFDEAQKVPELFDAIKLAVDEDRESTGKYVLSGSSQFVLNHKISESLSGRIGRLELLPYQWSEIPAKQQQTSLYKGCYPELVNKDYTLSEDWLAAYLSTYIEKDVRDLANIGDLRDFQRLIQLLAINTAQTLNLSTYAKKIGVDVKTIKRWMSILEASYIIYLLPPFYENYGKRVIKSPKIYFYDTGLVSHLTGVSTTDLFEKGPMYGAIFENYIVIDILKNQRHNTTHKKLYYYRASNGDEVDLIIDHKHAKTLIEIKSSETFRPQSTKMLSQLMCDGDDAYLLYRGVARPYTDNIHIEPYNEFLTKPPTT